MIAPTMQPTSSQPLSLAQAPMSQADAERKTAMRQAWKAYRGEFPKPLVVAKGKPDDNVIANFAGPIVDKGASWLFGQAVKIEALDKSTYQKYLDGFWGDDDDKMTLLSDLALNGGVCGEAFVKLIAAQGAMKYPRLVVLDPQLIRVITAPDDCSLILAYVIEYPGIGDWQKRQVIARVDPDGLAGVAGEYDLDDTWTITNYVKRGAIGGWQQVGSTDTWQYPFAPIFATKNLPNPNEPWGTPDLTPDLIEQNKVLNFLLSNLARIVKFHGHPKTWAKGVGKGQLSTSVDDLILLADPNASLNNLPAMENFSGILQVVANIMSNIDQQSRVPAVALGRQEQLPKLGNISGVALSLMFQPLIEKTMQKRRLYGKLIREVSRAALVLGGLIDIDEIEDCSIDLHWPPLLPADNLTAAQEALILQQLNVSQATIFAGLGLDPDDEAMKKAKEDAVAATNFVRGQGMPPAAPNTLPAPGQAPTTAPAPNTQQQGGNAPQ